MALNDVMMSELDFKAIDGDLSVADGPHPPVFVDSLEYARRP
jgi:hypothetical protein